MFFERCETIRIDGKLYEVSNASNVDHFNCKLAMCQLWALTLSQDSVGDLSVDNYLQWKKDAIKALKDWDKMYVKHEKTTNKELGLIHATAFIPLTDLWEATNNYYNINKMVANGVKVPDFRTKALEDQFILKMTTVCDILANYGQLGKERPYDIRQMLQVLKIENWREIKPFKFFLQPLLNALNEVIEELLRMRKAGPLKSRYFIEHNEVLQEKVIKMIEYDIVC